MATNLELQSAHKTMYSGLRQLEEENIRAGIKVKGLKKLISLTKSVLSKEDIAWVEEQIAECKDDI